MKKMGNVLWGIVLIVIGLIFGLNALGITDINVFFRGWWTLFIIIPSLIGFIKKEDKMWSLIWLIVGIALLLGAQNIISFSIVRRLAIPVILVIIGLSLIFREPINRKLNEKIAQVSKERSPQDEYTATFGGQKIDLSGQEFKGANIDAIFGGVELNIENAIINQDQIINTNAIFGGIDIKVPKNVNIKVKSTPIFGGIDNKVKGTYNENLITIYINGFCLFGGVEIK